MEPQHAKVSYNLTYYSIQYYISLFDYESSDSTIIILYDIHIRCSHFCKPQEEIFLIHYQGYLLLDLFFLFLFMLSSQDSIGVTPSKVSRWESPYCKATTSYCFCHKESLLSTHHFLLFSILSSSLLYHQKVSNNSKSLYTTCLFLLYYSVWF